MRNLLIGPAWIITAALAAGGCSSDDAFGGDFDADGNISSDGGTEGDGGTMGSEGDTGAGVTESGSGDDGGDTSGSTTGDDGEGTSTGGDTGGDDDPCNWADCGEGECIANENGETWCECPEGFIGNGDSCQPCPALGDLTELTLDPFEVTATFTINGDPAPQSVYQAADFWLENRATGDRVEFGKSYDSSLGARVLPGAYDLVYTHVSGDMLPRHTHYVVQPLFVRTDLDFSFNLPAVPLSGDIRLNGEVPPTVQYDDGNIFLVNPETGDELEAGSTRAGEYSTLAFPGTYELHYRVEDAGDLMPANADGLVGSAFVDAGGELNVAHVDLQTTVLSGDILINGAAPPAVQYDDGNVFLRTAKGDEIALGSTRDGNYSVNALAGEYQLEYEVEDGGIDVPANTRAQVSNVTVQAGGPQAFPVNIPRVQYSGNFTLNGAPAPASQYDDGTIRLRDVSNGSELYLGNTHEQNFSVGLIPGDYEVIYSVDTAGSQMPVNVGSRVSSVSVQADLVQAVNVQAVPLSGAFTLAGAAPPQSEYEDGRLYLRKGSDNSDAVLLGYTHDGGYQTMVTPGDYEVFFTHEYGTGTVPDNSNGLLMGLSVTAAQSFDVDVPVVALAGSFTIEGAQTPNVYTDSGELFLRRRSDGDAISLGSTQSGTYQVAVTPGTYEVFYERSASVESLPRNEHGRVTCFVVE